MLVKSVGSGVQCAGLKMWLHHLLALYLYFLLCKMGTVIVLCGTVVNTDK